MSTKIPRTEQIHKRSFPKVVLPGIEVGTSTSGHIANRWTTAVVNHSVWTTILIKQLYMKIIKINIQRLQENAELLAQFEAKISETLLRKRQNRIF